MSLIRYSDARIGDAHLEVIDQANAIIGEYSRRGIVVTLRQLYYQFVARDLLPENSQRQYKRLGDILRRGRYAGLVSWEAMEDITRNLESLPTWGCVTEFINDAPAWFHVDLWDNQPCRVVVGIEKDAGLNSIARVCRENDVPYISCRGYFSASECWRLGRKMGEWMERGQDCRFLYWGDHDPSGIDMTRDLGKRLSEFADGEVEVIRLGLNMDQILAHRPPPNFVKVTDSRKDGYVRMMVENGFDPTTCWELDALPPTLVEQITRQAIEDAREPYRWEDAMADQERRRDLLSAFCQTYDASGEDDE